MRTLSVPAGQGLTLGTRSQQTPPCETVQQIINIAATAEALAVTLLGVIEQNVGLGRLALNPEELTTVRAARAEEELHYRYLTQNGAKASTLTFTIPDPKIATDVPTFFSTLIAAEELFIASYIAAAQEFALQDQARLAQLALQIGGVEAEHRVGLRYYAVVRGLLSGTPNDVAFEKALFSSVGQAAQRLQQLGFIGGTGTSITYPGPGVIDLSLVTNNADPNVPSNP